MEEKHIVKTENVRLKNNISFDITTILGNGHKIREIIYLMISPYNPPSQDIITKNKIRFM